MQFTEQSLVLFFEQMAKKEPSLFEKLKQHECFRVESLGVFFTLPDLHRFLCQQDAFAEQSDYKKFRQLLFQSPINQKIKPYGAEIQIAQNNAKVDHSLYVLLWPTPATKLP